ncbi:hypothetical protein Taro_008098, partial [Colocasia esculenta]|nr:hypothetical protein [Colocasia esculenta]
APNCYFGNPFLGVVRGGTGRCSSLTSWSVQGVVASACVDSAGSAGVIFGLTQVVVEAFTLFPLLCSTLQ